MKNIIETTRHIIAEHLGHDTDKAKDYAKLVDDLGADSLDLIELVMMTEETFGIEIDDAEAERITTVGEVIAMVIAKKGGDTYIPAPPLKHKYLTMALENGEVWGVPVEMIARNRATHYAHEFGDDIERSMAEDTIPLFNSSDYDIVDWAVNNMNWSDFTGHQVKLRDGNQRDFQSAWMECEKGLQ